MKRQNTRVSDFIVGAVAGALLMLILTTESEASDEGLHAEVCELGAVAAAGVMELRLLGLPLEAVLEYTDNEESTDLAIAAYQYPLVPVRNRDPDLKEAIKKAFADQYRNHCYTFWYVQNGVLYKKERFK